MRNPNRYFLQLVGVAALGLALTSVTPAATAAEKPSDLCARVGYDAGWRGNTLKTAIAIGMAESTCNPAAYHTNSDGSIDRGLWQINSRWQPEGSKTCAYDAKCNGKEANRIYREARGFSPWSTYNGGQYRTHLTEAANACKRTGKC